MNGSTSVPRWRVRATVDVLKQGLELSAITESDQQDLTADRQGVANQADDQPDDAPFLGVL